MGNTLFSTNVEGKAVNLKAKYSTCNAIEEDLLFYKHDIQSLQSLLDTNFDDMVKIENLDEMRESLMGLQDLQYDNNLILKQVRIQQNKLRDAIEDKSTNNKLVELINEQSKLEKKKKKLSSNHKMVKKELISLVYDGLQIKNKNIKSNY